MTKRLLTSSALFCALFLFTVQSAVGQVLRPEATFYLTPRVGIADYIGELDDFGPNFDNEFPWYAGVELGYQFTPSFALAFDWGMYNIPGGFFLTPNDGAPVGVQDANDESNRQIVGALLRYTFRPTARVAPFLELGGAVAFANPEERPDGQDGDAFGYGPAVGLGLDIALNLRTSLLLGARANAILPDETIDGLYQGDAATQAYLTEMNLPDESVGSFDLVNAYYLGLKFNFKSAARLPVIAALECADVATAGDPVSFNSVISEGTEPITYRWNFGDGGDATGQMATHTYQEPGTYTVTLSAENRAGVVTESCVVTVNPRPVPPSITTLTASQTTFDVCEPRSITFTANVAGTQPIEYSWNFGDGATETTSAPTVSHVFSNPGTYTVTLTATSSHGTQTRTMTVTAEPCRVGICYEITEMNAVFFPRNSSELTPEARAALQENLDIFLECANLCGQVVGYAAPGERNPDALSQARAQAVADFYGDNGVAASRLTVEGRGVPEGQITSKKEGVSQFRRVDTIPVQCEDMQ